MKQTIQKPAVDVVYSVDQITVNVNSKQAIVRVTKEELNEYPVSTKVVFDILEFLTEEGYTATQKTGIKKMFKQMIAKAWGIAEAELTGDIFVDEVIEEPEI